MRHLMVTLHTTPNQGRHAQRALLKTRDVSPSKTSLASAYGIGDIAITSPCTLVGPVPGVGNTVTTDDRKISFS